MNKIIESKISKQSKIYKNVEIIKSCLNGKASVGDNSIIRNSTLFSSEIGRYCKIIDSYIEKATYIGTNCFIANAKIGKYCSIAWNISIGGVNHNYERLLMTPLHRVLNVKEEKYEDYNNPLVIGNDVWIGANAVIMRGLSIGDGAIIGAGSVVTHDVKPYSIVCGNPATILKYRFEKKIIDRLLSMKVWDLDEQVLNKIEKKYFEEKVTLETLDKIEDIIKKNM